MLEMHNISKVYRTDMIETHALREFSLQVAAGEFVAVSGPSGSGKTTFLNVAGLLETFDGGTYKLDGQDVSGLSDNARSRIRNEKIGFVFQSFNLIPDLDIFDNVDVPLRYRRMKADERRARITPRIASRNFVTDCLISRVTDFLLSIAFWSLWGPWSARRVCRLRGQESLAELDLVRHHWPVAFQVRQRPERVTFLASQCEGITNSLELVGLSSRMRHLPSQLSGGQQQRAAIARAIAGDPALILADEPTGNLDSLMASQIMDLLEKINSMGTTVVLVTHDPELARRAQRNIHVVDGLVADAVAASGPAARSRQGQTHAESAADRGEPRP